MQFKKEDICLSKYLKIIFILLWAFYGMKKNS